MQRVEDLEQAAEEEPESPLTGTLHTCQAIIAGEAPECEAIFPSGATITFEAQLALTIIDYDDPESPQQVTIAWPNTITVTRLESPASTTYVTSTYNLSDYIDTSVYYPDAGSYDYGGGYVAMYVNGDASVVSPTIGDPSGSTFYIVINAIADTDGVTILPYTVSTNYATIEPSYYPCGETSYWDLTQPTLDFNCTETSIAD